MSLSLSVGCIGEHHYSHCPDEEAEAQRATGSHLGPAQNIEDASEHPDCAGTASTQCQGGVGHLLGIQGL
jgi:hypothetical protein